MGRQARSVSRSVLLVSWARPTGSVNRMWRDGVVAADDCASGSSVGLDVQAVRTSTGARAMTAARRAFILRIGTQGRSHFACVSRRSSEDIGIDGRVDAVDQTESFEAERPRLLGIASRVLADHAEAEDVVQQAWLRLHRTVTDGTEIDNLPAWLTTVTTRLCLDRLRARTPVPVEERRDRRTTAARPRRRRRAGRHRRDRPAGRHRPALAARAGRLRAARQLRLRVLHHRGRARHVAGRGAQARLAGPRQGRPSRPPRTQLADWEIVDAFMAAARERRLRPVAPAACARRRGRRRRGRDPGRHASADRGPRRGGHLLQRQRPDRPSRSSWATGRPPRGSTSAQAKVVFDFDRRRRPWSAAITFRAEPELLAQVARRDGGTTT